MNASKIFLIVSVFVVGVLTFISAALAYSMKVVPQAKTNRAIAQISVTSTPAAPPLLIPTQVATSTTLNIVFAGDLMFDRNVYVTVQRNGNNFEFPFLKIAPELARYDVRVANLEGPITTTAFNIERAHAMSFTFDPAVAPALAKHIDVVSLANNHTFNFGAAGLESTKKFLQAAGMDYFGDPNNRDGFVGRIIEKNGFKIALIGYHAFAQPEKISLPVIEKTIRELRPRADIIVVMPHWGVEYQQTPSSAQVAAGHRFIDAGADIVIGGHPHVVETSEVYKGRQIYYSLGNFIFDQYFSKETMEGEMVAVQFIKDENGVVTYETKKIPYQINKYSQPFIP